MENYQCTKAGKQPSGYDSRKEIGALYSTPGWTVSAKSIIVATSGVQQWVFSL